MVNNKVIETHLLEQKETLSKRFERNKTFQEFRSNLDSLHNEVVETFHQPQISPTWVLKQAKAKDFLVLFIKEIHLARLYRDEDAPFTPEDFLTKPPRCDFSEDRAFWKMLASFVTVRLQPNYLTGQTKRSVYTALLELSILILVYKRYTGLQVDQELVMECTGLIEQNAVDHYQPKHIATFSNVASFIKNGIFGKSFVMKCPREQVQLAAMHLLMAFCAVRPSEVVNGRLKDACLRYGDLKFYLALWSQNDETTHSDESTQSEGSNLVRAATSNSQPLLRLQCNVHFKGKPADKLKAARPASLHAW